MIVFIVQRREKKQNSDQSTIKLKASGQLTGGPISPFKPIGPYNFFQRLFRLLKSRTNKRDVFNGKRKKQKSLSQKKTKIVQI